MHIRKYDFDYSRRFFLEKTAKGLGGAGVLGSLWPMVANSGEWNKAYPEELTSIEVHTKGKIKPGDVITADNVEHVEHLLDPVALMQVKTMGRRIHIVEPVKDVSQLMPAKFLEATLRNSGNAVMGDDGNVYNKDGTPWSGGMPFPNPKNGVEATYNLTLSWGRHDYSQYAVRDWDIDNDGDLSYQYDFVWCELNTTGRSDGKVWRDKKDLLRYQSVFFTAPNDSAGTSFLNVWHYDQRKYPDLHGYIPAFRRVRQFPTNQRFEPLVPGITLFLSDAWAAGDPLQTWGNYKIVGRQPMLGVIGPRNFHGGYNDNWEKPVHGGPKGQTFFDTYMELVPECLVVDAEPTGYARAPVGKKRTWIDVRNQMHVAYITYDRRGDIWKSFEGHYAQQSNDKTTVMDGDHPAWSWSSVHSHDVQSGRMSRFVQAKTVTGGYDSHYEEDRTDVYNKYLTIQAMQRLGAT